MALTMDENEKEMTKMVCILLENSVITFVGGLAGGLVLGPGGLALGASVLSGSHLLLSEGITTWSQLKAASSWKDLVLLTLKVAVKLAIQNYDKLFKLALAIVELLQKIFNSNHATPISY